jgi:pimeloyl-ACP methyl ester carboxylesterase
MEPVLVIHGTFASEGTWWRPTGSFCERLDSRLKEKGCPARCWDSILADEVIGDFRWEAPNSEAARTHAAEILSKKIISLLERPEIRKLHFVAHSHGGNVLLKSLFLSRRTIDSDKLGNFVFLGTPFYGYKSLQPRGYFWRNIINLHDRVRQSEDYASEFGGAYFVIRSKHDEAFHLLRHALHLRESADNYSRRLSDAARSRQFAISLNPLTLIELRLGRFNIRGIRTAALPRKGHTIVIGYFSVLRMIQEILPKYFLGFFLSIIAPFKSILKQLGQQWGVYFGIKAIMSTALGDDLAFERNYPLASTPISCRLCESFWMTILNKYCFQGRHPGRMNFLYVCTMLLAQVPTT